MPQTSAARRLSSGRVVPCSQDGQNITTFHLHRLEDESGISGTGCVAEGAVFSNGWVVLVWLTDTPSLNFYPSIDVVEAIHGHGGMTRIVFD
jgi:hypothetical protein